MIKKSALATNGLKGNKEISLLNTHQMSNKSKKSTEPIKSIANGSKSSQTSKTSKTKLNIMKNIQKDDPDILNLQRIEETIESLKVFDERKELLKMFDFKTKESISIETKFLKYASENLNRDAEILRLTKYVGPYVADKLEMGTLEFTLIKVMVDRQPEEFIVNIYRAKINDILANIDDKNERIANHTLRPALIRGYMNPYFIAFLSPEYIHPMRWKDMLDKRAAVELENNNVKVTDLYKCYKCGNRKSKTSQMQTRGADEPMTIFVTCMVCYNTFTK
jgi:DNA-directed RNA polymerase subunit M/transcription elongation factor TFIIS